MRGRILIRLGFVVGMMCWIALFPSRVRADARTDYLINMLENGRNYRIRVQAATTLGKLRSKQAVPALVRSLGDDNDLVVISALTALGQIGDPSVISQIEKACAKKKVSAVQSQLEATLRVLRALSSPTEKPDIVDAEPRFLIRVDAMGNSSGKGSKQITDVVRDLVLERLKEEPDVVLQVAKMNNNQVKRKLKKEKLVGYILSGSIIQMDMVGKQLVVKVGLNVFSNPEYNLLMMPTAQAAVSFSGNSVDRDRELALQEKGLRAVVERLVGNIVEQLRQTGSP